MSCHPKLGETHATLSQTQLLSSIGARQITLQCVSSTEDLS
ncbi:hypothetical protein [Leptospira noguchii]|nr:hypothetical protein [Leptospira noguchii]